MNAARHLCRLGYLSLAIALLSAAAAALQAGDTAVEVPAAAVAYTVPGVWEKREPHEAQSVCAPSVRSADGQGNIDVELFPNEAKKTYDLPALKAVADAYAGTMQEIHGADNCEITEFDSGRHVRGYRIHYTGGPTHFTTNGTTFQCSIYVFANDSDHLVFLTYTAEVAHFSTDTDMMLQKTIALTGHQEATGPTPTQR